MNNGTKDNYYTNFLYQQKSVPGKRSLSDPEIHFSKPFAHPIILTVNPSSENCGKFNNAGVVTILHLAVSETG